MYILVDDSSQKVTNFGSISGFGSIWISEESLLALELEVVQLRIKHKCWGELKWTNVDKNHSTIYLELIDLFIKHNAYYNQISFINHTSENIKVYHSGDKKVAEMKAIFALILYNYQRYATNFCKNKTLKILFDKQILKSSEYKEALLNNLTEGKTKTPIEICTSCHSHILGSLQLTDLLVGAGIAYTCFTVGKSNSKYDFTLPIDKMNFFKYTTSKLDLKPVYSGKPLSTVKSNNWFYQPRLK